MWSLFCCDVDVGITEDLSNPVVMNMLGNKPSFRGIGLVPILWSQICQIINSTRNTGYQSPQRQMRHWHTMIEGRN